MLKLSQYVWIGMALLSAMVLGVSGASLAFLASYILLSLIPAIAGIWVASSTAPHPFGEATMLVGWTLLASLTVAISGGEYSPAIILFAIGPLTAFVFRRSRLAMEGAVFAALAYLGTLALSSFGIIPNTTAPHTMLGRVAAAIGIVQILMLVWAANRDRAMRMQSTQAATGSSSVLPVEAPSQTDGAAEKLLKERNAYYASLGHDLRTPFTAILGYAEAFKMNLSGNLTEKQIDQASIIHESAQDLLALVDDMMDLAKSEAGKLTLDPEPIHLGDLGKAIMLQMQSMADRKNITMSMDVYGVPWAMADARLVRRIWQNLISNAIKYSEPDSTVQLTASERARYAILSVKDDGRGMSEQDLARIAEPFAMGDNSNGKAGTGLGLVNVRRFAEMHGGKVVIDTAPNEGARFQVMLPKADIAELEPL